VLAPATPSCVAVYPRDSQSRRVLCRVRPRGSVHSLLPSQSGSCRIAHPISSIETRSLPTLTRSYPCRFTFYVADPISSIVSRQLPPRSTVTSRLYRPCRSSHSLHCISAAPAALDRYLTALPAMSLIPFAPLKLARRPHSLAPPLVALPSMSLIPSAPFDEAGARNGPILTRCCAREHVKRPIFVAL
jgi:hypothetical protein